jgi:hypothetical protein
MTRAEPYRRRVDEPNPSPRTYHVGEWCASKACASAISAL